MKRWGLWVALMLSLGFNVGVLFMVVADRAAPRRLGPEAALEPLLPAAPEGPAEASVGEVPAPPVGTEPPPSTAPGPSSPAEAAPSGIAEPSPPPPVEPPPAPPAETPPPDEPIEDPPPPPGEPGGTSQPAPPGPPVVGPGAAPSPEALRRAEPKLELLADRLRLRGVQRQRFLEVQRRFFTEVTARRVELATLRQELRRELTSPEPDRPKIRRILERSGRATAELDAAFAENVLAVRRILGPRQQRAYFVFLERLRSGMNLENRSGRRPGER